VEGSKSQIMRYFTPSLLLKGKEEEKGLRK